MSGTAQGSGDAVRHLEQARQALERAVERLLELQALQYDEERKMHLQRLVRAEFYIRGAQTEEKIWS